MKIFSNVYSMKSNKILKSLVVHLITLKYTPLCISPKQL